MSVSADYTNPEQPDMWWADVDTAPRCGVCGTRLDKPERACPFSPHGEQP